MAWPRVAVLLLWMNPGRCSAAAGQSGDAAEGFGEKLNSGKPLFVYFGHQVSPAISRFLVQLEKSAEALHDYGISVAKVNCSREHIAKFCTGEKLMKKVYLFRNSELLKSFDVDAVFDVNSIVSHVLFSILFDEVRYVQTDADLQALERTARGKSDLLLGYVLMLGTQEHRALMETVFVYGARYQFILTTGGPVLEHLGMSPNQQSSAAWFLHCRLHGGSVTLATSERCPLTPMRRPLSTLSLHSFLQLMDAPLLSEVFEDPSTVPPPQPPLLHTPQLFLFSRPGTEHLDLDVASTLAWRLRGLALLLLVHRESPAVKTPEEYNVAYRLPGQGSEVKYLTLNDLEEVTELFVEQGGAGEEQGGGGEEEEEGDEEEEGWPVLDVLDDEVADWVYRTRGSSLDSDSVTQLTSDDFHAQVAQHDLTVALFYLKWDAVSKAFLSSFNEVADRLEESDISDVHMVTVDCGEWTDLCAGQPVGPAPATGPDPIVPFQPITAFPSVLLLRPRAAARHYSGTLGTEALHRFIMLSRLASPVLLPNQEEVTLFLQGAPQTEPAGSRPHRVLGLFKTHSEPGVAVFLEATTALRGEVLSGMLTERLAERWAAEHGSPDLPLVLVFRSSHAQDPPKGSALRLPGSADELLELISNALLDTMPELTVENLPSYLALGRPLLLLFVGEEEEDDERGRREVRGVLKEMRGVVEGGGSTLQRYLPCWIHLGRTLAGTQVLESLLGSVPPLPALILSHLPSGELYHYPPNVPIMVRPVLRWLHSVEEGQQRPAGSQVDPRWAPDVPFFDFLSAMDQEEPGYARQRTPRSRGNRKRSEEEEKEKERGSSSRSEREGAKRDPSPSSPHSPPPLHSEL